MRNECAVLNDLKLRSLRINTKKFNRNKYLGVVLHTSAGASLTHYVINASSG